MTAVFFTLLWYYAANGYRLVDHHLEPTTLRAMTRRYVAGMVLYTVTFALTFINVVFSLTLVVGLALLFILPEPGSRPGKPEPSAEDEQAATEKPDGP
jgi:ABC-type transport system involved in cytochrome bd biosynthesis fused ATPase/permease subunit